MDLVVIFTTFNRSAYLLQTLEAMTQLERVGLNVQFVVVDNNSTDDTSQVIDSFADRLPLVHLFEARPGKNCALNHALDSIELGDIVVFTDDDVIPHRDWLKAIIGVCERWPDCGVFGGKIDLIWPEGATVPSWALTNTSAQELMFSRHNMGDVDRRYLRWQFPFGPNFWVRREVFSDGRRFDESIGPRPGSYRMGSETSFLQSLAASGYPIIYSPDAVVGHHVRHSQLSEAAIREKCFRRGRGTAYLREHGHSRLLEEADLLVSHRAGIVSIVKCCVRCALARISFPAEKRVERIFRAYKWLGYNVEMLRLAHEREGVESWLSVLLSRR